MVELERHKEINFQKIGCVSLCTYRYYAKILNIQVEKYKVIDTGNEEKSDIW